MDKPVKPKYYTLHYRHKKRMEETDVIKGHYAYDVAVVMIKKANKDFPDVEHWMEEI
jgi:hypothetical protein